MECHRPYAFSPAVSYMWDMTHPWHIHTWDMTNPWFICMWDMTRFWLTYMRDMTHSWRHIEAIALLNTGWRRLIGSPKLQIIFHKRATKCRSLLQKMTCKDKGSYESSPPCISHCMNSDVWHDSFLTHICVWQDSFLMCLYVRLDSFLNYVYVWHDSFRTHP